MDQRYRVGEMAAMTRVSVRALRHYDRVGVLRPSRRTEGGQRLYSESDLLRLQQVLTLRYLGFSLRRVRELLETSEFDVEASLVAQQAALREQSHELGRVQASLAELLDRRRATGRWDWELVARASATVQANMSEREERMEKHYTPEQKAKDFADLGKEVGPEGIKEIERQWTELLAEVKANLQTDPASPQAQALGDRWEKLVQGTFRGRTQLMQSVAEDYRAGKFEHTQGAPSREMFEFIRKVNEARKGK